MTGFQRIDTAQATLAGMEQHRMLRKHQHHQASNQTIFQQFQDLAS
jgi:transposase-like protein